jgi:hypothetical protein
MSDLAIRKRWSRQEGCSFDGGANKLALDRKHNYKDMQDIHNPIYAEYEKDV